MTNKMKRMMLRWLAGGVVTCGVAGRAAAGLMISSPLDYQVVQRHQDTGVVEVRGTGNADGGGMPEARWLGENRQGTWRKLEVTDGGRGFQGRLDVPAGGWYRIQVRSNTNEAAEVAHVGVGEVFVVAGQSNSANHGEQRQTTTTGKVAAFNGNGWQPANDPIPGASGGGGSFMPALGDALVGRLQVPVGFIACGVGATSVRQWLPRGVVFANPPTLTGNVVKRPDGQWESQGALYERLVALMKQAGPNGFRAVLWHQGESDANQPDATRSLAGDLYRKYLGEIIRQSRREIGWEAPWMVAQVTYHVPGDEASPDIRAGQAALWRDGLAVQGPDSDALKGPLREAGGRGIHFSGPGLRAHGNAWADKITAWLAKPPREGP